MKPVMTEKALRLIEAENKLVFELSRQMSKQEIKQQVEKLFDVKVEKVNVMIKKNKKYAYVKLKPEYSALDIATKLGIM